METVLSNANIALSSSAVAGISFNTILLFVYAFLYIAYKIIKKKSGTNPDTPKVDSGVTPKSSTSSDLDQSTQDILLDILIKLYDKLGVTNDENDQKTSN